MRILGEICLLTTLIFSGYAGFACSCADRVRHPPIFRTGLAAALLALAALTATLGILGWALVDRDFSFDYVAKYTSKQLDWRFSLSALWVGQAGSLLLWAWLTAALATIFRFARRAAATRLCDVAYGLIMAYVCFLTAIMVFAADPMHPSLRTAAEGAGLSPLLQHPTMLIHPPIVFLGYAAWTIPAALALAALWIGRIDGAYVSAARPWALFAWIVLGSGILLGADWAYEELGWGGYWSWDPVENGSLIPWLTGTVLIHALMVWRYRDGLKKTALALAIATFGLCNFATFLTRSGIFSSLHAFSQSPIGWMFLVLMLGLLAAGTALMIARRRELASTMKLGSVLARETLILVSSLALLLLTSVVLFGTALLPASMYAMGNKVMLGPGFYNAVLTPIGLVLLVLTVPVPLLRWGKGPTAHQRRGLLFSVVVSLTCLMIVVACGITTLRWETLFVTLLAITTPMTWAAAWLLDARRFAPRRPLAGLGPALSRKRQSYAAYLVHLGFALMAVGIVGSSFSTQKNDVVLHEGEVLDWNGRQVRFDHLAVETLPDKIVGAAQMEVREADGRTYRLLPARHFHTLQAQWTTEVAIHSSWSGDTYAIFNSGAEDGSVSLTLIDNPLMRWLWLGGMLSAAGGSIALWPRRSRSAMRQRQSLRSTKSSAIRPSRARSAAA